MRYLLLAGLLIGLLLTACAAPGSNQSSGDPTMHEMIVYQSPTCGCCSGWVGYVEERGYTVTMENVTDIAAVKAEHNVPLAMQSCHTAVIDGYVIEGHVPADAIDRLLTERPDVVGIAVPGMPIGSPGMEMDGVPPQPFDVVTFDAGGNTEVYASYHQ
jgi:hypothetical protein